MSMASERTTLRPHASWISATVPMMKAISLPRMLKSTFSQTECRTAFGQTKKKGRPMGDPLHFRDRRSA